MYKSFYWLIQLSVVLLLINIDTVQGQSDVSNPESSYLLLPSAYTPATGQLYLENIAFGYFGAEYGFSKNFSGKASFELFNPLFADEAPTLTLTPKVSFDITNNIKFAASYINIIGFDNGYVGIPHGVMTIGERGKHLSVGYGHAFYNFFSVNTSYDGITIGGQYSLNDHWSVVTDNWVLLGEPNNPFANSFDFFSLGLSKNIKDRFQLGFGLTYFTEEEDLGNNPWPYVKFSGYAQEIFKKRTKPSKPKKVIQQVESGEAPAKAIFIEGLGAGLFYSLNYDSRFSKRPKNNGFGFRAGISYLEVLLVPIQINYLVGYKHYLEIASGLTLASKNLDISRGTYGNANVTPTASIGYRYQPAKSGFMLRINADAFLPLVLSDDGVTPWLGLSLGYRL